MAMPLGGFQDRPYQTEAVGSIWNYFYQKQGNPLVAMPTGTGKSVVIARFLQSVYSQYPFQRIMLLTHVKELIGQNFEKLLQLWPFAPAGIYSAGLNSRDNSKPITFAGIASVAKKAALFGKIDLILIDECHLMSPDDQTMYRQFIAALRLINPHLKVIGFTATPWRMGHGHLIDPYEDKKGMLCEPLFTDVCFDITGLEAFNRLIAEGYLCPLIPRRPKLQLDTEGLHLRGGEFIDKEMQERFGKQEITEAALREAMEVGFDRNHWLIFASGVDHANSIYDMLNMMGVPTGVVHSKVEGRDKTIEAFKAGDLRALVNNNVLTTGFDYPQIDMIMVLRATLSAVLWVQMLGRGTRTFYGLDGKGLLANGSYADLDTIGGRLAAIQASEKHNCLVLDYARNTAELGAINDPKIPKKKGEGGGTAPVKLCEVCETYNHISVRFCTNCNAEFDLAIKFKETSSTDEVIKGEMPITEVFKVDHISVDKHEKDGRPPMMKVTYYCGYKNYPEYVCVQHKDFAGKKAARWWKDRTDVPMPETTDEAIAMMDKLAKPTHIRVWTNKKYPELMAFCYDGTAFGAEDKLEEWQVPDLEIRSRNVFGGTTSNKAFEYSDLDDDVPF